MLLALKITLAACTAIGVIAVLIARDGYDRFFWTLWTVWLAILTY